MAVQFKPELVISVAVSDWAAARKWYSEKLGFTETWAIEEGGWAEFQSPLTGAIIGLSNLNGEPHPGAGGVTVTFGVPDIDAARAELEGNGVAFDGPTNELPGMVKLATFRDPDGNTFMLAQNLMEA